MRPAPRRGWDVTATDLEGNQVGALGSDLAFIETIHEYFAGTMMDARRYFEPVKDGDECDGEDVEEDSDTEPE